MDDWLWQPVTVAAQHLPQFKMSEVAIVNSTAVRPGQVRQTRASRQQFSSADHLNRQWVTTSHAQHLPQFKMSEVAIVNSTAVRPGRVRQTRASQQQFSFADHLNRQWVTTSHVYSDHLTMAARRRRFAKALNPKLQRMKGYEIHSGHETHAHREIPIELWSFSAFYKESL